MKKHLPFRAAHAGGVPGFVTQDREPFFQLALEHIRATDRVLDIGSGDGQFARMRGEGDTYLLDGNPDAVSALRAEFGHVEHGVLPTLPYEDGFFDAIHCSHVLEHLSSQDVYESLREMDRCLAPGGTLILSGPVSWHGFFDDLSHVRPYPVAVLARYLCGRTYGSLTRASISSDYRLVAARRRYARCEEALILVENERLFGRLLRRAFNLGARVLGALGVYRLVPNGETVVFRKGS